jgi:hypothetical protein
MDLTPEEKVSIAGYTGSLYGVINDFLRFGEDADESVIASIGQIDSAIAKSKVNEDLTLYRGVDERYAAELQRRAITIGDSLVDAGFLSTSKSESIARRFLGFEGGGLLFKIRIPEGRKALPVGPYSKYPNEEEFLLPRETELRIVGYDAENDVLELEVV